MMLCVLGPLLAPVLACPPQQPGAAGERGFVRLGNGLRLRAVDVPDATHLCVAVVVTAGSHHDPRGQAGLAQVLGRALTITQEGLPEAERFLVETHGRFTALSAVVAAGVGSALRQRVVDLLAGGLAAEPILPAGPDGGSGTMPRIPAIDADTAARAIAAAALEADDMATRLPGPILEYRARRALLGGTPAGRPAGGLVPDLQRLTAETLRARCREQFHAARAIVVLLGAAPPAEAAAWQAALAGLPRRDTAAELQTHDDAAGGEAITTFALTDAPYVTLAIRAPDMDQVQYVPWLVALAMVQARAALAIGTPRHAEMRARFPYMSFAYREGDSLVLLNRRGENGAALEAPQQEIEHLLHGFLRRGISPGEVRSAANLVASTLALPPYQPELGVALARHPRLLAPRAVTLALAELFGRPADLAAQIAEVPVPAVQQALGEILARERAWFALLPEQRSRR